MRVFTIGLAFLLSRRRRPLFRRLTTIEVASIRSVPLTQGTKDGDNMKDATQCAAVIVEGLKKAGIKFVATLPDEKIVELITAVENDTDLKHVPLCREEEGIGLCAGAYLAGSKTALIMQNAGFLNSCNALTTTSLQFQIPILLLIYYAGDLGDRGFTTLGSVTEPVLQAMGIRYTVLRRVDEVADTLRGGEILADDSKKPVAVLLTKSVLGVE
jgi:sulfopyruvate decarboxylase subunit alpha